jgi:hypothetical protein
MRKRHSVKAQFIPIEGMKASYYDDDHDKYVDVVVDKLYRRGISAKVHYATARKSDTFDVAVDSLDFPLEPDINERFKYFSILAKMLLQKELSSMYVTGEGGLGKGFTTQQVLDELEYEENIDFVRHKGHCSPKALYNLLKENHDGIIILDDIDAVIKDKTCANIIKAVCDSYKTRKVSWLTTTSGTEKEQFFYFTGSVLILSNIPKNQLDGAIRSRSAIVDLYMTPTEVIERMRFLKNDIDAGAALSESEKDSVLDLLDKYKNTVENLNIRTLRKSFQVYERHRDISLVKYQILNS